MYLRYKVKLVFTVVLCLGLGLLGCRSAVSTHVERDPDARGGWATQHMRGVPVTVRVPNQLEVRLVEYRYVDASGAPVMLDGTMTQLTSLHAETIVRERDVVFTVDAVRPASGTLTYSSEFTKQQFFKDFNSKVVDTTIQDIANSIKSITSTIGGLPKVAPKSAVGVGNPSDANLQYVENVIAVQLFDVYDPNLATEVREFLHKHLNNCAPSCNTIKR
jgi:hypothetical protein